MSDFQREAFAPIDLAPCPYADRPVVLASGGPIMNFETAVDEGRAICSWPENGAMSRRVMKIACLRSVVPLIDPAAHQ